MYKILISPLRKWLIYNNFFTKEKNNHTNLLLDGGKLNISDDKYLSFLKIYTKDLENNFTNYICETKNDYLERKDKGQLTSQEKDEYKVVKAIIIINKLSSKNLFE